MIKVSKKRQITLPKSICEAADIKPGDYVDIFVRDGMAHIVKMKSESLAGKFNHLITDKYETIPGFIPLPTKGNPVTNEIINKLRDEEGV